MAKLKCPFCTQYIEPDQETVPYKKRTAHKACFNSFIKQTTNEKKKQLAEKQAQRAKGKVVKPPAELKDGLSEEEYKEKQELYKTVREIQGQDEIEAKTYKLVDDFIKRYKFSYLGIKQALTYFYKAKDFFKEGAPKGNREDCIGIVPYIYSEAQKFYSLGDKTLSNNEGIDLDKVGDMYQKRIIKIKSKSTTNNQVQIDIGSIGD